LLVIVVPPSPEIALVLAKKSPSPGLVNKTFKRFVWVLLALSAFDMSPCVIRAKIEKNKVQ